MTLALGQLDSDLKGHHDFGKGNYLILASQARDWHRWYGCLIKITNFRPLVTVRSNDITDGGSVKISQHDGEQPSTRIFPRYCSDHGKGGLLVSYFYHLVACIILQFKHSSDTRTTREGRGGFSSDITWLTLPSPTLTATFCTALASTHSLGFMMTSAHRTPNQMCPSLVHKL